MLKFKNIRNKKHLEFIRTLPCVKCSGESVAAHLRKNTDGGLGLKPSDCYTLPLCHNCHSTQHNQGELTFWGNIDRVKHLALKLYRFSEDRGRCLGYLRNFREKWI